MFRIRSISRLHTNTHIYTLLSFRLRHPLRVSMEREYIVTSKILILGRGSGGHVRGVRRSTEWGRK